MTHSATWLLSQSKALEMSLRDVCIAFLAIKKDQVKITTFVNVKSAINNYLLFFLDGNKKVSELRPSDFEYLKGKIERKTSRPNFNKTITYIKQLFNFVNDYYGLRVPGANRLIKKRVDFTISSKKIEYYSPDEFKKLISCVPEENHIDRCILLILYFLGLRMGELRALQWQDIDAGRLTVCRSITSKVGQGPIIIDPKSVSSIRSFLLPKFILKELNKIRFNDSPSSFVFKSRKKNRTDPIGETTIERIIRRYSKKANIPYLHPHGFRHSCASYLVNELHLDIYSVSKWLGHSNVSITSRIYVHLFPGEKDKITKSIEDSFSKK